MSSKKSAASTSYLGAKESTAHVVIRFVKDNAATANSKRLSECIDAITKTKSWNHLFEIPVKAEIFNADDALRWLEFLHVCAKHSDLVQKEEFSNTKPFDLEAALTYKYEVYDILFKEDLREANDISDGSSDESGSDATADE